MGEHPFDGDIILNKNKNKNKKNPAPRYFDLQGSQVMCTWFGLNKMYANMYINVCSGHTGCGKLLNRMVHSQQNFYSDGHVRYRKSKRIMMAALENGIRRDRYTTYLCPQPF